jgi:hypothetical protein
MRKLKYVKLFENFLTKLDIKKGDKVTIKKERLVDGFYLTVRPGNNFNKIINSRDKSTGRAEDVSSLSF